MKLFHHEEPGGNFGDDLNTWIWKEVFPGVLDDDPSEIFVGIGTIIGNNIPTGPKVSVFSSGAGYLPLPMDFGSPRWSVWAVRGPLTAELLGLKRDVAVADGALLLQRLPEFLPLPESSRSGTVFIPHHKTAIHPGWPEACGLASVKLVDPRSDSRVVIQAIRTARLVLAESMHAAIIADVLRVPWIPVTFSPIINTFKWLDWAASVAVPYEPEHSEPPSIIGRKENLRIRLYGKTYRQEPRTIDEAVAHQRRFLLSRKPRMGFGLRKKLGWVAHLGPRIADRLQPRDPGQDDERAVEEVATFLRQQTGRVGYLSDNDIVGSRVDELYARAAAFSASRS